MDYGIGVVQNRDTWAGWSVVCILIANLLSQYVALPRLALLAVRETRIIVKAMVVLCTKCIQ